MACMSQAGLELCQGHPEKMAGAVEGGDRSYLASQLTEIASKEALVLPVGAGVRKRSPLKYATITRTKVGRDGQSRLLRASPFGNLLLS